MTPAIFVTFGVWGAKPLFSVGRILEAQQSYFSYRAILVAIVSRNAFMLVFMGYRTIIARYVAKWGIAQIRLCETKYQGGVSRHFGGSANLSSKVSRDTRYRSDSIAVSRDMGPLRVECKFVNFAVFLKIYPKHSLCHPDFWGREIWIFWGRGILWIFGWQILPDDFPQEPKIT